jgi:hypothetical protein
MPDASASRSVLARIGWLLAELAVVFVGVYGAFWLDGFREQQRLEVRRDQIVTTLCSESDELRTQLPEFVVLYDSLYVFPFTDALDAGERPLPRPLDFYTGTFNTGMWEATLASGGLDALDYDLIREAQQFYTTVSNTFAYTEKFLLRIDGLVLPNLERGESAFYAPGSDRLRPGFEWYSGSLMQLKSILEQTRAQADALYLSLDCAPDPPK